MSDNRQQPSIGNSGIRYSHRVTTTNNMYQTAPPPPLMQLVPATQDPNAMFIQMASDSLSNDGIDVDEHAIAILRSLWRNNFIPHGIFHQFRQVRNDLLDQMRTDQLTVSQWHAAVFPQAAQPNLPVMPPFQVVDNDETETNAETASLAAPPTPSSIFQTGSGGQIALQRGSNRTLSSNAAQRFPYGSPPPSPNSQTINSTGSGQMSPTAGQRLPLQVTRSPSSNSAANPNAVPDVVVVPSPNSRQRQQQSATAAAAPPEVTTPSPSSSNTRQQQQLGAAEPTPKKSASKKRK